MRRQTLFNPDNSGDDICRTIKTTYHKISTANLIRGSCFGASGVIEIETMQELIQCKQLRKQNGDKGMKFNAGNKEYSPRTDGVSNTLSTSTKDNMLAIPELRMEDGCLVDKDGKRYRIRKLTPTECFRLMDVEDKDIEKMKFAGIAKTNLYKLAGNSIVVSCMYHIFRKLFIEKQNENQQLELF